MRSRGGDVEAQASRNAGEEGSPSYSAGDRRESHGCVEAVSCGRQTGGEEGQGSGEGQSAVGEAESGLTKEKGMNATAGIVLLVLFVAMLWFGKPRKGIPRRFRWPWRAPRDSCLTA